jgi:putative two-component system response regulator
MSGEDIPLMGRVCALADVFDALTSKRPYKNPWSMEDATSEIQKYSGGHFEPKLVESFMSVKEEIYSICQSYA